MSVNESEIWQLYWRADTGAYAPEVVLELCQVNWRRIEIDADGQLTDISADANDNSRNFATLSPLGQVPVLILPDNTAMTESVAMMFYLADSHPQSNLLPATNDPRRAHVYRWMMFLATNIYDASLRYYYSERYTTSPDHAHAVQARAREHLDQHWDIVENRLYDSTTVPADSLTLVDIYIHMLQSWHPDSALLRQRCPKLALISQKVHAHPAIARIDQMHPLLLKTLA